MNTTVSDYTLNFGPQHPAAHGVLRLLLELNGETIVRLDPHIGFLHRGTEKLVEQKPYEQSIGYMDRLDYVSMMCNEHAYVMAMERLLKIDVPPRAQYIRVLFDEMTRLLNHLLWLGGHALDVGAMTVFLYTFQEREVLMDCYEAVTGARMHAFYYRPGGVARDLPDHMPQYSPSKLRRAKDLEKLNADRQGSFLDFIERWLKKFPKKIDEFENLLTDNRIFKQRTVDIGILDADQAIAWGCTGPVLRASGVVWDLRKVQPYEVYDQLTFRVPTGTKGDCYDRYLVRVAEMRESVSMMQQCIDWLRVHEGPVLSSHHKVTKPDRSTLHQDMESLIHHFKMATEGFCIPEGETYAAIEHPKGEFGIYLISDGSNKPYRLKIRSAGFMHLAALNHLAKGHMLSDLVAILSSLDIVFGEIDR